MAENRFDRKIQIIFDVAESDNYKFMPETGKIICDLDSGEKRFIMKLIPKEKSDAKHLVRKEIVSIKAD